MIFRKLLFLFTFIFNLQLASAERYIETSSLLTCMQNSQLTASYFNVVYTPNDTKVYFDVSAISTLSGYIRAHMEVIVYGLTVVEKNLSMCDLGYKNLCPISAGRIDVDSNYEVSSSYTKQIPAIAFTVPDLDAKVKVTVYNNDTTNNTAVACVEALLTNGKTVQTKYASWPIAAISGLGLITSGVISVTGHSNTAAHIASNSLSLFVYFQNLAITSMMAVDRVPPIAAAWCQNFQWSMGIIHLKFLTKIANWYVQATGGTSTSVLSNKKVLSISVQKKLIKRSGYQTLKYLSDLYERAQNNNYLLVTPKYQARHRYNPNDHVYIAKRATTAADTLEDSSLYNTDETNTTALTSKILVLRGIQRVAYLASIEITSLFFTGMVFTIFFAFVLVVCLSIFKAIIELLIRANVIKDVKFSEYRGQWRNIIKGALYRLFLIGLPQIVVLCLWELTERDSVACVVMAIVLLIIVLGILVQASIKLVLIGRESVRLYKNPAYSLYGDTKILNKYGFLYVQYSAGCYYWIAVSLSYIILRSLIIAVLQHAGKVQAVIIFVFELVYFIALCCVRPYMDRRTNIFNILIHLVNLINAVFFLIFSNLFGQKDVVSSISGVVLFVLNAIFSLILLIFTIVTCVMAILYKNPDTKYTPVNDDRVCFIKRADGDEKLRGGTELGELGSTALRGHEDLDLMQTLSHQHANSGTYGPSLGKNNGFEDDDYDIDDKFPSSRLPTGAGAAGAGAAGAGAGAGMMGTSTTGGSNRNRSDSLNEGHVVQPGSLIYNNHGSGLSSGSLGAVSKPSNVYGDVNTGYKGMSDTTGTGTGSSNTLGPNQYSNYGGSSNMYPYDMSGSSTNLAHNPYGRY